MKLSFISQTERVLELNLGRKDLLAAWLTRVTQQIEDKGDEIRELENAVNGLRTRGAHWAGW